MKTPIFCGICRDAQGPRAFPDLAHRKCVSRTYQFLEHPRGPRRWGNGGRRPHISNIYPHMPWMQDPTVSRPVSTCLMHKKHTWFLNNSWQQVPQGIAQKSPEKIRQMNQMNDTLNHFCTQFSTNLHSTTKIDATLLYDRTQRKLDSDPTAPQLLNSGGTPDF
jgi:hypothetical protein